MDVLLANRRRAARAPRFLDWLSQGAGARIERSPHGEAGTLMVDGAHLAGPLAPERDAERSALRVPLDSAEAWALGTGDGNVIARLLERPRLERLRVVGLSSRSTFALFSTTELPWLDDPRVALFTPHEVTPGEVTGPSSGPARTLASADLRLAEPSPLRDALVLHLARDHQEAWLAERRRDRVERGRANLARFTSDGDVATLFGRRRGERIVVAGGGPSLNASLAALAPNRPAIVAASTALAPLERVGLAPAAVVMVDPHPGLAAHLDAVQELDRLRDVPLVYAIDLDASVLARWPGPRRAALLALPGYDVIGRERGLGSLFCSGTVLHTAVDLAVRMGASEVLLAGADLSYPGGRTHAEGTAFAATRTGSRVSVECVSGGLVATDVNLLGYLRDLERYIAEHPEVRFVNMSPNGALIRGSSRWNGSWDR